MFLGKASNGEQETLMTALNPKKFLIAGAALVMMLGLSACHYGHGHGRGYGYYGPSHGHAKYYDGRHDDRSDDRRDRRGYRH
jgi:hypothetical protein